VFDTPFKGPGDWSGVEKQFIASYQTAPVVWRLKIVLIASIDDLVSHENGTLVDNRNTIMGARYQEALDSIPQFIALVSAVTDGKVRVLPDVLIDPEPSRDRGSRPKMGFDETYLTRYLESRINGGRYDADDKVYRGPYNSVLFLDPCGHYAPRLEQPGTRSLPSVFSINETPSSEVCFDAGGGGSSAGSLAVSLFDAWSATVSSRATAKALPPLSGSLKSVDWTALADLEEPKTDVLLTRIAARGDSKPGLVDLPGGIQRPTYKTGNISLAIIKDAAKGDVLQYTESKTSRSGGVVLPHGPNPIDVTQTPSLSFSYKTNSDRPISFAFRRPNGKVNWVSLGRDAESDDKRIPVASSLPLQSDGTWHEVSIDLKALGSDAIDQIWLGASPSEQVLTAEFASPVTYQFSSFHLGSDAATSALPTPTADAKSADSESRCLDAVEAQTKGLPSPALAGLLVDPDDRVVLNALAAYGAVVDPFAEPKLIELASSPSPRTSELALRALSHQNTTASLAAIAQRLQFGFEYSKEIAARLIAAKHDPASAPDLSVLLAGRLWHTRLAAAEALGELPGKPAEMFRLEMVDQEDPIIKLAVVENTDVKDETDMRKMLWTAVNEPSDRVRASSYERLAMSPVPNMQAEGLKGVRDDSWWTRVLLLRFLKDHPLPTARGAVKLGLTDRSASVRSAAIEALAAFDKVTLDELKPCLDDANPQVDLALIQLAKLQKLQLPDSTLEILKKSPDPAVVSALGR
jgi:HEAT repeat protein